MRKEVTLVHGPMAKGPVISVRIMEELRAKNFEDPRSDRRFMPSDELLPARIETRDRIRWLVVLGDKPYGWPEMAVTRLTELDRLRVYVDGEEGDPFEAP